LTLITYLEIHARLGDQVGPAGIGVVRCGDAGVHQVVIRTTLPNDASRWDFQLKVDGYRFDAQRATLERAA
jgi:hypothetical protein